MINENEKRFNFCVSGNQKQESKKTSTEMAKRLVKRKRLRELLIFEKNV